LTRIFEYLGPAHHKTNYEKQRSNAFIVLNLIGLLLLVIMFTISIIQPNKNVSNTMLSLASMLFIIISSLYLHKKKGIKWIGNIYSMALVFSIAVFLNILDEEKSSLYKYLQGFYTSFLLMSVAVLFSSRKTLIINAAIILLSATRVFIFSINHEPDNFELFLTGFIQYVIVVSGFSAILYFAIKFAENAIFSANEDARIKELKNQELAASEEEIRANNEELRATTDALKETNSELVIAKEKAEESNRLKSAFLTNISHEIRTPLNGIVGFSNLINDNEISEQTRNFYSDIIVKSCEQLLKIIDDTLEISKLSTKKSTVADDLFNLNHLTEEVISVFKPRTEQKKLLLILENGLPNNQCFIRSDETKLYRILYNLIENAVKFTHLGYIKVAYKVVENSSIEFSVEDTGIGFDQKNSLDIFDSFVQAHENIAVNYGGLGVGLSIAKENIDLLGGQMKVQSIPNQGSIFQFSMPYIPQGNEDIQTHNDSKPTVLDTTSKRFVLIAEDEDLNYLFLKKILLKMNPNLEIFRAENGVLAVEICKSNPKIELIFMDVKMPLMSGIEATAKIREFAPDLPIVIQTAYTTAENEKLAFQSGCNDLITKPIDIVYLEQLVSKYLYHKIGDEQLF